MGKTTTDHTHHLPAIDWPTLLRRAPFFSAAIIDALCEEMPRGLAPHVRAVFDFDLFDAQVSNGGVDQYFRNVLLERGGDPGRVPASIAHNPALAGALPFVDEVHAIWRTIAPAYTAAAEREDDDEGDDGAPDCDAILAPHAERIEALQQRFFAAHHAIRQALEADIVRAPGHYFAMAAVPGLRGRGIEHVVQGGGAHRLRFDDGFPVGPNTLENEDGSCDVVWFSRDRTLVQAETSGWAGNRDRRWIHYPSQASGSWSFNFNGEGESVRQDSRSLGLTQHGVQEFLRADGRVANSAVYWHGQELRQEFFYPDGGLQLLTERTPEGNERHQRHWPGGQPHTDSVLQADGRTRYTRCLDAEGRDLAPGGNGRLVELLSLDDGMRQWREGALVAGYLHGPVVRMASHLDGTGARETERRNFDHGQAQDW
ncbi:hypothetical protein PMI14_01204 [Acidovorax sp. CF316]|uniref:hypothetical protein n=1 Tax=Acidovorax sp. CF316 TaxID=1144317 RepID=UPI00026BDAB5|nr:hypothetical protein [Acidovorax sp. CF316]EJE53903.1 hypothetical protein PMI14_01204 [Acidovorax sp. CF316]